MGRQDPDPCRAPVRSSNDPRGFAHFYEKQYPRIFAFFLARVRDPDRATDLTAETFAQAFEARDRFRGKSSGEADAWIFTIARYVLYALYRTDRVHRAAIKRLQLQVEKPTVEETERLEEIIDAEDAAETIERAIAVLTEDERAAIEAHIVEERGFGVLADDFGVSEAAVRKRVSRALVKLRGLLESLGDA